MLAQFDFRVLADVDAALNACAFVALCAALVAIKRGNVELHKKLIFVAVGFSAAFLACYLVYHCNAEPVKFGHEGWLKLVYYPLLISHVVLAAVQVPLILRTLWLGLQDRRPQHLKWATIWLYVSATGVVVYWMLYWL
jgi:putative membrane protein